MRKTRIDMTGLRYGRLYGMAFSHRSASGHALWCFRCDCGAEVVALGSNVRSGKTQSCGCLHRECCAARLTTHGHRANRQHEPSYRAWQLMNDGCANPASPAYHHYGAQGIAVCAQWKMDFARFLSDMGPRPSRTVLMLVDPMKDFGPGNCRWAARQDRSDRAIAGWQGRRIRHNHAGPEERIR